MSRGLTIRSSARPARAPEWPILVALAVVVLLPILAGARLTSAQTAPEPAIEAGLARAAASTAALQASDSEPRELLSSELLVTGAGRVAWSAQGDRIAYDKAGADGLYDLWVRDMEVGFERCLTCDFRDFRQTSALSPAWHPNGKYLVFLGQQHAKKLGLDAAALASPRRGLWTDLWLVRADGKDYWQLTRSTEQGSATLDPHFSYEGDGLLWSERVLSREGRWGTWRLRTAVLRFQRGIPRLSKVQTPTRLDARGLILAQGYSPDDKRFLTSAQLDVDPGADALEMYWLGATTEDTRRLTRSRGGFHQYARVSPRGDLVAFTSDAELRPGTALRPSEIWLMKLDGSEKRRLTRVNDGGHGSCSVGAFAWSPRGDRIVAQVLCSRSGTKEEPGVREDLYLFQLSESLARPSVG